MAVSYGDICTGLPSANVHWSPSIVMSWCCEFVHLPCRSSRVTRIAGVVGVVASPAAATGAGVLKLKVLGEVAPAASGLPPKVKGVPPLGDATDGEDAAAAAPNENAPFPAAPEAAVEGSGVWPKPNPVAAALPPLEGELNLNVAPGCCG